MDLKASELSPNFFIFVFLHEGLKNRAAVFCSHESRFDKNRLSTSSGAFSAYTVYGITSFVFIVSKIRDSGR